jgi:Holliday junction resolvase RusA-like endonuclease
MRKPLIYHLGQLPDPQLNPNKRLHFYALAKAKREAKDMMIALVKHQGSPKEPLPKAHITITWIEKHKYRRDIDNLFASMKAYIDGLVTAGVLVDDNADCVSYTLRYERGNKNDTVIEITSLEEMEVT